MLFWELVSISTKTEVLASILLSLLCLWLHLRSGKWQKYGLPGCMSNFSEARNCTILMQGGGLFHILQFHSWLTKMGHSALCEPWHFHSAEQPALLCVCVAMAEFSIVEIRCMIAFLIGCRVCLFISSTGGNRARRTSLKADQKYRNTSIAAALQYSDNC